MMRRSRRDARGARRRGRTHRLRRADAAATSTSTSFPSPVAPTPATTPITVTVQFEDVLDLVPQSAVKVDDVTVGKVDDVGLDGYPPR